MPYQLIRQHSEEDCGAACLATIAKHHGRLFTLNHVREVVGTGQLGTSLLGLKRGAEALGFNARGVRVAAELLERLEELPLPGIIHWQGNHWVVLYGQRRGKFVVADPAIGVRYLSKQELTANWGNRLMLLLEPDPIQFLAQLDDKIDNFSRFLRPVWNYRALLAEAFLINGFLGLLSLASPFLLQILTDEVLVRGDFRLLTGVMIAVVVMSLVSSSLRFVQSHLIAHFAQRLQLGLVLEFGRQLLRLPLSYFESHRSGEIVSRLQDIQEINQLVSQTVIGLPSQFFIALISFGFMLTYSGKLTLVALLFAGLMTLSTLIFLPTLQQKTQRLLVLEAESQGILVETFKGALTLKATTAIPQLWEEFQIRFGRLANLALQTIEISIINNTFSGLVSAISSVALLGFGSSLVIGRELSIGQLLAFNSMNSNFLGFIAAVVGFTSAFVQVKTSVQRLTEVIDATPEDAAGDRKPMVKLSPSADIICTDLTFYYAGRVDLLENFCLKILGGRVTALIGTSGCGKSTLAKLIAGLYVPQSGNIQIDGYNLSDIALDNLRQQVMLVPQDAHFWSRSIVENFRLGAAHVSFEEIVQACRVTGADDFISKLPDKYQTVLGEFGANLSGGQRQRLAIARTLVFNPAILILDESTAGLDPLSEAQVLDRLLAHRQGMTTLLISHRPRVIQRADWLVVLEQGRVMMQGSPEDLSTQAGNHLYFLHP
jgi:ATP-binding cassette subfamily C protein